LIHPPPSVRSIPLRNPTRKRHRRRYRRLLPPLLLVAALGLALLLAARAYLASLPSVDDAEGRVTAQLAQHGGSGISLPPHSRIREAAVAVEDRRFYQHHGLDSLGLMRAAWDLVTTGSPHGGATITEQLAEALYGPKDNSVATHLRKAGLAVKLEQRFTKDQILDMYLNAVYYGDGQWGIAQASQTYFDVPPTALSWGEAALLAGLPNAPSAYDPLHHYDLARRRQRLVLVALVANGTLSPAEASAIYDRPPVMGRPTGA
jgi:membrane peptidoglycan carboxypeptidase